MNYDKVKYSQNFITSNVNIKSIVKKLNINKEDIFIEIGPGKGHFTNEIASHCRKVVAVEVDNKLVDYLKLKFKDYTKIQVINSDILEFIFPRKSQFKIFGNIPFNLSTEILKKIALDPFANEIYLIVEFGFAKRLTDLNKKLGLMLLPNYEVSILREIPKVWFHPMPNVDACLVLLNKIENPFSNTEFNKYNYFIDKWSRKEFSKLFTKNQLIKALKYSGIKDNQISRQNIISIYKSYLLFNNKR